MIRPSWNDYFKELFKLQLSGQHVNVFRSAVCSKTTVLLLRDTMVLPGCPHESKVRDGHEQATIHAEQNAVTDCAKRGGTEGASAYITHYPCINCMKILCAQY